MLRGKRIFLLALAAAASVVISSCATISSTDSVNFAQLKLEAPVQPVLSYKENSADTASPTEKPTSRASNRSSEGTHDSEESRAALIERRIKSKKPEKSPQLATLKNKKAAAETINLNALSDLQKVSMAFSIDNKFNVAEEGKMKVVIDPTKTVDSIKSDLRKENYTSSVGGSEVNVSKIVVAKAIAIGGLSVIPITPEEQVISTNTQTEWIWNLRASEPGIYEVKLTLTAVVSVDGQKTQKFLKVFEETITIEITLKQRIIDLVNKYWQWIFSTLIIPLAVWIWNQLGGGPKKIKRDIKE